MCIGYGLQQLQDWNFVVKPATGYGTSSDSEVNDLEIQLHES